jgi:hypothetical protein
MKNKLHIFVEILLLLLMGSCFYFVKRVNTLALDEDLVYENF